MSELEPKDIKLGQSPFDRSVEETIAKMKVEDPNYPPIAEAFFKMFTEMVRAKGILPPQVFLPVVEQEPQRTRPTPGELGRGASQSAEIERPTID